MTGTYLTILTYLPFANSLIIKNFFAAEINPFFINESRKLVSIQKLDVNECAYFCMKSDIQCNAFMITKEGSCQQVPLNQSFLKGVGSNKAKLYTEKEIRFGKQITYEI